MSKLLTVNGQARPGNGLIQGRANILAILRPRSIQKYKYSLASKQERGCTRPSKCCNDEKKKENVRLGVRGQPTDFQVT